MVFSKEISGAKQGLRFPQGENDHMPNIYVPETEIGDW